MGKILYFCQQSRTWGSHHQMNNYLSTYRDFISGSSSWYKLLFVCFIVLVFFMLTGILGMAAVMITGSFSLQEAASMMNNPGPADIPALKLFQAIQTIGLF